MTWGSFLTQSLNLVLVLPLILTRLSTPEISLWFLFSTIISMQMLADIGFSPTFSRVIAYAMGGASYDQLGDYRSKKIIEKSGYPNWDTLEKIYATMSSVYTWLTLLVVLLLITIGTWSLKHPISLLYSQESAWICWAMIIITSAVTLRGNKYSAYLQGTNNIAILRRWEMYTSLLSIISNFTVLLLGGGLLGLVISHQVWRNINVVRNRYLSLKVAGQRLKTFQRKKLDPVVLKSVWPSTWRSGLGIFMSRGLVEASGVIYANLGSSPQVAAYLLGLRLIRMVSQFSQAPFYSKLPILAKLRSMGNIQGQIDVAKRGMRLAYWSFVLPFIALGFGGPYLLPLIKSNAQFPDPLLWSLLGFAMFAERYGAMHIQLYSTTNHIIWHKANGIAGIIFITFSILFFNHLEVYAFPVSLIISYCLFYCWYASKYSYKAFLMNKLRFECSVLTGPILTFSIFIFINIIRNRLF